MEQWEALPEWERRDWLAYDLRRQSQLDAAEDALAKRSKDGHYTPEVFTMFQISKLGG